MFAQQDATAAAQRAASEEAVRRSARRIDLRTALANAQALQAKGDMVGASKEYERAWDLVQTIGVTVEQERAETIKGLAAVRLELAKRAEDRGNLDEADKQVSRVLRVDPTNTDAQHFKAKNDRMIADRVGKEPSKETLQRIPEIQHERVNTSILVQDARVLMEMGKLDEAEAKLKQAVKEDPEHRAAFYYLKLIKEKRYAQESRKREISANERIVEVESAWNTPITRDTLPIANPYATTNRIYTSAARAMINRKLDGIILEKYEVPGDLELSEVIKDLQRITRERDVDKVGINLIISSFLDKPGPANLNPAAFGGPGGFGGGGFPPQIDPLTGQPIQQTTTTTPLKVEDYKITIDPPLYNVSLRSVLDAIVKVAKPPEGANQDIGIKYSIEDYAVVFSQREAQFQVLYTRTFRVNPNTFVEGLDGIYLTQNPFVQFASAIGSAGGAGGAVGGGGGIGGQTTSGNTAGGVGPGAFFQFQGGGGGGQTAGGGGGGGGGIGGGQTAGGGGIVGVTITNRTSTAIDNVRAFFLAAGLNFATNNFQQGGFGGGGGGAFGAQATSQQKALFFNDRTGILMVRATLAELDIVENAIQALNVAPPQVTIEARVAEISQRDNKAVGFDWYLGNILMAGGKVGTQGGTAPSFSGAPTAANPSGVFPNPAIGTANTDNLITSGLTHNPQIPALATVSGILTDPQFRVVIRALEQREGVDLLSAPKVTTVSGRQARIDVEDTQTIILGLSAQGIGGGGIGGVGGGGVVGGTTGSGVGITAGIQ